jgi:hypothetical protein
MLLALFLLGFLTFLWTMLGFLHRFVSSGKVLCDKGFPINTMFPKLMKN